MLDGVRGIAIALVLYHHFVLYSGFRTGGTVERYVIHLRDATWLGVDVFFVLSGFLITGILYDTKSSSSFFKTFYSRRTLRIFPLYYGVLAILFFLAPALTGGAWFADVEGGQVWYWTYLSNVDVALNGWREPLEIGHFWSLAVEEQFYLIWPLVVWAASRERLLRIVVTCFGLAFVLRWIAPLWLPPLSVYILMPMRMDALAAGAFVALVVRGPKGWAALTPSSRIVLLLACLGLGAITLWRRGFRELDPVVRTAGYSLVAVATAALIAVALTSRQDSPLRRALGNRVLVTLGTYSYGLYVFHHIVVIVLRRLGIQAESFAGPANSNLLGLLGFSLVAMTVSSVLAYVSWHVWEMPFLRLKRFFEDRRPTGTGEVVGTGMVGPTVLHTDESGGSDARSSKGGGG